MNLIERWMSVGFLGGLRTGETVLIHAGGSGVGTAAVQLVALAGAKSIVTAGSQEKIKKALELGASAGFNYKEGEFAKKVLEVTAGIQVLDSAIKLTYEA